MSNNYDDFFNQAPVETSTSTQNSNDTAPAQDAFDATSIAGSSSSNKTSLRFGTQTVENVDAAISDADIWRFAEASGWHSANPESSQIRRTDDGIFILPRIGTQG